MNYDPSSTSLTLLFVLYSYEVNISGTVLYSYVRVDGKGGSCFTVSYCRVRVPVLLLSSLRYIPRQTVYAAIDSHMPVQDLLCQLLRQSGVVHAPCSAGSTTHLDSASHGVPGVEKKQGLFLGYADKDLDGTSVRTSSTTVEVFLTTSSPRLLTCTKVVIVSPIVDPDGPPQRWLPGEIGV